MMANKCSCEEVSLTPEGFCANCDKIVPWSKLMVTQLNSLSATGSDEKIVETNRKFESPQEQLKKATEKVIRIASIFDLIGTVLNVINYILAVILFCVSLGLGTAPDASAAVLPLGLLITAIVWIIGWIQTAILRGLSAYFLMKGLAQQKAIDT